MLYQAGSSPKGRDFAARHAECIFVSGPSQKVIAPRLADIRRLAVSHGRKPDDILIFALATVIVAPTEAEARAKHEDYLHYVDREGALALMSGFAGVDLAAYGHDEVVRYIENDAGRSAMENITRADPDREWTVGQIADHVAIGGIGPVICGSPSQVANALEDWIDATGIDGFNLAYAVAPETMMDFVDLVVPEPQRRGRYKRSYASGTLREKLFTASSARLTPPPSSCGVQTKSMSINRQRMTKTLIIPGLHGSGPQHWQTWLQAQTPRCERIEQDNWAQPDVCAWSRQVELGLHRIQSDVYIVAHSFGCLATVAASATFAAHIKGALLVAPADPEKLDVAECVLNVVLPFPSMVVASRNDPWMTFERAAHCAGQWGSRMIDAGYVGHINVESGHGPWPRALTLLDAIKAGLQAA